jgi:hypothetical protein
MRCRVKSFRLSCARSGKNTPRAFRNGRVDASHYGWEFDDAMEIAETLATVMTPYKE